MKLDLWGYLQMHANATNNCCFHRFPSSLPLAICPCLPAAFPELKTVPNQKICTLGLWNTSPHLAAKQPKKNTELTAKSDSIFVISSDLGCLNHLAQRKPREQPAIIAISLIETDVRPKHINCIDCILEMLVMVPSLSISWSTVVNCSWPVGWSIEGTSPEISDLNRWPRALEIAGGWSWSHPSRHPVVLASSPCPAWKCHRTLPTWLQLQRSEMLQVKLR